jgi:hypothetical protein
VCRRSGGSEHPPPGKGAAHAAPCLFLDCPSRPSCPARAAAVPVLPPPVPDKPTSTTHVWGWLVGLWDAIGCSLDPNGCATVALQPGEVRPEPANRGEIGCTIDLTAARSSPLGAGVDGIDDAHSALDSSVTAGEFLRDRGRFVQPGFHPCTIPWQGCWFFFSGFGHSRERGASPANSGPGGLPL